ncbi:MAG: 2-phosphosulfolactate phosphatase [Anaerolineae bacterium]|nr:2-phosphosulfolactate phosphatase [Anaerolineae bacterium]
MLVHKFDPFHMPGTAAYPVAVIDVCRAFTTAAYALSQGAEKVILVRELTDAFRVKSKYGSARIIGEDRGYPVEGFDYWNSPVQIKDIDFSGVTLIQRTTAGTRAMLLCQGAPMLLAASFVVAEATVRYMKMSQPAEVGLVSSGWSLGQDGPAEEDAACANYLGSRLMGRSADVAALFLESRKCLARWQLYGEELLADLRLDVELCLELDRFDFAMPAMIEDGALVLRKVHPPA